MNAEQALARGQTVMEQQFGAPATVGSVTRPCVPGQSTLSYLIEPTGELRQYDGMIVLSKENFDALALKQGDYFTMRGQTLRVAEIMPDGALSVDVHYKQGRP